jgi:F-type H+-transporting ATPase subunit delta
MITYSLQTMPRLAETLNHPLIPTARKKAIVADIFKGKVQDVTLRFLELVIDKRREQILPEVEPEYVRLANEYRDIVSVIVTSAVTLSAGEVTALKKKLDEFTGKNAELELREDAELIGGLTARIGDTVIDGSVRGYLASLREQLLG